MFWWADDFDEFPKLIKSNGKDAIHFPNGAKIYFRTRTKKTGRGLSIDLLVFDECFDLPNEVYAAMAIRLRRALMRRRFLLARR